MEGVVTIQGAEAEPPVDIRIERMVVPTRDAQWTLGNRLDALLASAARPDGSELLLIDDARELPDAALLERARRVAESSNVRITHLGPGAKEAFAASLARASGVDPSLVRFALLGEGFPGLAYGAHRNLALLASCGRPFLSLDDDMGGWVGDAPDREPGIAVADGDPTEFRFCRDLGEAMGMVPRVGRTLLATHGRVLGRRADDLIWSAAPRTAPPPGPSVVARKLRAGASVAATWTGFAGDVATPNALLYLAQSGVARKRLLRDEATFDAAWRGRQVVRAARKLSLADGAVWTTGATAYDARQMLPPFFPVLRGEGLVWGATLRACHPGVVAFLPDVVPHLPRGERDAAPQTLVAYAESYPLAKMLHHLAMSVAGQLDAVPPQKRLHALGDRLRQMASVSERDFAEITRRHRHGHDHAVETTLRRLLQLHDESPAFWAADVHGYIERVRQRARAAAYEVPSDICEVFGAERGRGACRDAVSRYGQLLAAWPDLWEAARAVEAPWQG